jgi:mono/diheme cytochrome c family protein
MDGDVDRGAYLATAAGCANCHGEHYAGGYALETKFGTFYAPNITPDPAGIGGWTADDFVRALRRGKDDEGHGLAPAFPFPAYTGMSDGDLADLWAFVRSIPPDPTPSRPADAQWIATAGLPLWAWRLLELQRGPLEADPDQSAAWNRGRYLVVAVAHCGECHTPRNALGGTKDRRFLGGNGDPPEPSPKIAGLGWTPSEWGDLLTEGMTPDDDVVGGVMRDVVHDTAKLTDADRAAMALFLVGQ